MPGPSSLPTLAPDGLVPFPLPWVEDALAGREGNREGRGAPADPRGPFSVGLSVAANLICHPKTLLHGQRQQDLSLPPKYPLCREVSWSTEAGKRLWFSPPFLGGSHK